MKKFVCLVLTVVMLSVSVMISVKAESGAKVPEKAFMQHDVSTFTKGFEEAEFEKFNSPAEENGLGGTRICVKGTLIRTELHEYVENTTAIMGYVQDVKENVWLVFLSVTPTIVPADYFDRFIDKETVMLGVYEGYSGTVRMPAFTLVQLMDIQTDEIVSGMGMYIYEMKDNQEGTADAQEQVDNGKVEIHKALCAAVEQWLDVCVDTYEEVYYYGSEENGFRIGVGECSYLVVEHDENYMVTSLVYVTPHTASVLANPNVVSEGKPVEKLIGVLGANNDEQTDFFLKWMQKYEKRNDEMYECQFGEYKVALYNGSSLFTHTYVEITR